MTKTGQDLEVYQGEQKQITWDIDRAGSTDAQSLTGATTAFYIYKYQGDSTSILSKASSDITLVNISDTDDGVRLTLDSDDTSGLTADEYYYELWAKDASSVPSLLTTGSIRIKAATGSI